jgi:hypothetical protein
MNIWLIRICKTASTSLEMVCESHPKINLKCKGHNKLKCCKPNPNFETLCCVRNPYDRLVSAYEYTVQNKKPNKETQFMFKPFREFVLNLPKNYRKNQFFHPQVEWIYDNNKRLVDHVLRFENLVSDWKSFLHKNNLEYIEIPNRKKTKRKSWESYYDKETLNIVYKLYKEDFSKLEYSK